MVKTQAILVLMCVAMAYGANYGNDFNYGNNYQYTGSYVGSHSAGTFNRNANSYRNYGGYNRYTPGGYTSQGYNKYASGVYNQMIVPHPYPLPVPVASQAGNHGNRVLVVREQGVQNNGFLGFGGNGIFGFVVTILVLQYIMQLLTNNQNQAQG